MDTRDILTLVAIFIGPGVGAGIALLLQRRYRKADIREHQKLQVVYDLIRARAGFNTNRNRAELESALNAIPIIFEDDCEVRLAHEKARSCIDSRSPEAVRSLSQLIVEVCKAMGYKNVDISTAKNIFFFPDNSK